MHARYRAALAELMHGMSPDFWVTLALNQPHSLDRAARKLEHLQAMVDYGLLGSRWKRKGKLRTQYAAVAEHESSNLHFHAVFVVPFGLERFPIIVAQSWKKLAAAGDVDIQRYRSRGASTYTTKAMSALKSHLTFYSPNASR